MKTILVLTITCFVHELNAQHEQTAGLLREAIFAEEAERDLAKAEKAYREILRRFDSERAYAATASLRLGEVLTARGETAEAEKLYARVLRDFADQQAVAEVAKARLGDKADELAGSGVGTELSRLQKMLKESPDLLNATVGGETPLERASGRGELEVVRYLLGKGADVKGRSNPYKSVGASRSKVVNTPLGKAVAGSHADVVDLLIEAGAPMVDGLLHTAASTGNLAVTKGLLDAGADPNLRFGSAGFLYNPEAVNAGAMHPSSRSVAIPAARNRAQNPEMDLTPLEIAAKKGFGAVARLLLENGAKPQARDGEDSYALLFAIEAGDATLVEALLKDGANANATWKGANRREEGSTALHIAADRERGEIVKMLLAAGANVAALTQNKSTPLHHASGAPVTVLLLEAGADLSALNGNGYTPLSALGRDSGGADKARALLAAGAEPNPQRENEYPPLMSAIGYGNAEAIAVLIEAGADVELGSDGITTPLCLVARLDTNSSEIIKQLVAAGADPNQLDRAGKTPLHIAIEYSRDANVAALLEAGAKPDGPGGEVSPPITALVMSKTGGKKSANLEEIVSLMVDSGAGLDAVDADGRTALYKAAFELSAKAVDALLEKGASAVAGNAPAFKAVQNRKAPGEDQMRSKLFIAAQREVPDRARMLRATSPSHANLFAEISAGAVEGAELPACPYSLFELYAFSQAFVSIEGPVRIWRMDKAEPIEVDLGKAWVEADPAGNLSLQWGDVVEFTSFVNLGMGGQPVSDEVRKMLEKQLVRRVEFLWREDAEGEVTRRQAITFYPGWQQAKVGRGWVLGSANSCSIREGQSEVSVLPTLGRLAWKEGDTILRPERWVVEREGSAGKKQQFAIAGRSRSEAFPIPEDGDVIVLEGRWKEKGPPRRRAAVYPPQSR